MSLDGASACADVTPVAVAAWGTPLAELMIDHDVGRSIETTHAIKRIDLDYFDVEDGLSPPP
jgi:restriction endonuclease Mrr